MALNATQFLYYTGLGSFGLFCFVFLIMQSSLEGRVSTTNIQN